MRSFLYIFISLNIPTPYSPHSYPYFPHSHPDSLHSLHSPHSHPYSLHSHPDSPHSHPDSMHSHSIRDCHVFMWQSLEIRRVFNTLLWNNFLKNETFFKKLEYRFLVEIKNKLFHAKLPCQKSEVQNGPITENGALPVTTLFFWKFCFSITISCKDIVRIHKCLYSYFS